MSDAPTPTPEPPAHAHVIENIAVLDMTGGGLPDLSQVSLIQNVAIILVPASLHGALLAVPMKNVAAIIPVPEGANVKLLTGQLKLTGDAFANPNEVDEIFVLSGQILVTTPVTKVGCRQLIVTGQLLAPRGSEAALASGITKLMGQICYFPADARFFNGEHRFSRAFFEMIPSQLAIVLNGSFVIEDDVDAELLRTKISDIVLNGLLSAPRHLIPALQFLATELNGELSATEDAAPEAG